ncbi:hypothetical protein P9112_013155 [Eukaryota sp. TZLM1-RC]
MQLVVFLFGTLIYASIANDFHHPKQDISQNDVHNSVRSLVGSFSMKTELPSRDVYLIVGLPGSGKQSRIDALSEMLDLTSVSTGNLLRSSIEDVSSLFNKFSPDQLGFGDDYFHADTAIETLKHDEEAPDIDSTLVKLEAKYYVEKGVYVPDKIVYELVYHQMSNGDCGFVFDGFPRTTSQAEFLLTEMKVIPKAVLLVDADEDKIMSRILDRRVCNNCAKVYNIKSSPPPKSGVCQCGGEIVQRKDDDPNLIQTRFHEYHSKTEPMVEYLRVQGVPLIKIPSEVTPFTFENVKASVAKSIGLDHLGGIGLANS